METRLPSEILLQERPKVQAMLDKTTAHFAAAKGGDVAHGHLAALKQLWSLTYREAQVQTFADAFPVIAVGCAIAALLVPAMRKVTAPTTRPAEAY
jgi:DHA2 family multidrug resistance protein